MRSLLFVTLCFSTCPLKVDGRHPTCNFMLEVERDQAECLRRLREEDAAGSHKELGCKGEWDNIACWDRTEIGETVTIPCPRVLKTVFGRNGNISRNCTSAGWSDVFPNITSACGSDTSQDKLIFYVVVQTLYTLGHSLSLIALTTGSAILCLFRKLHCTRNYIHLNLFFSFVLRAVAVLVKDDILFNRTSQCSNQPSLLGCKASLVFFQYFIMANFFWLLVEGLYLHTLLAVSFFSERKYLWWYILIGWGAPTIFISAWVITKAYLNHLGCWEIIDDRPWWIIKTPILVTILVNFFLFICIIRILRQKMNCPDIGRKESNQYSRLAKSTLLLIPLFGINYIIFAFIPDHIHPQVRMVFDLILGSFQGFVVAVLYCFLNGEVQAEIKRKWRRWMLQRFLGADTKYQQPSIGSNGNNFSTQITMLTKCSPTTRRASECQEHLPAI